MADKTYLQWPFFEERHRRLSEVLEEWATKQLAELDHSNTDELCKRLVSMLGKGGWCQHTAVDPADSSSTLDARSLCLIRETLARHDGLAVFHLECRVWAPVPSPYSAQRSSNHSGYPLRVPVRR